MSDVINSPGILAVLLAVALLIFAEFIGKALDVLHTYSRHRDDQHRAWRYGLGLRALRIEHDEKRPGHLPRTCDACRAFEELDKNT